MPSDESKDPSSEFSTWLKTRQYVRQRITRLFNKVDTELDSLTDDDVLLYVERLDSLKSEVKLLDIKIIAYHLQNEMGDEELDRKINEDEDYERKIVVSLSKLKKLKGVEQSQEVTKKAEHKKLRLPEIPLPEYSNAKDQSLQKFLHSFESIISKHSLSSYEKFIYLRNQLSKSPRVLVDSLDIQEQGYENAKELLEKAFGSDLTRKYDVIKRLANIRLNSNDDPYVFIGEMRSVINSFDNLEINVATVLQYFTWAGLNQKFQSQLINIINVAKPSLDQVETHIFEATERYVRQGEQQKAKTISSNSNTKHKETTALATNVNVGKKE